MDEETKRELCCQLGVIDTSLFFLVVLIAATTLSWKGTAIQREGLCRILLGESIEFPDVRPIRQLVSVLVIIALLFFFCLAKETSRTAGEAGGADPCSARRNLWASGLVLIAALIRQFDLEATQSQTTMQLAEEEEVPI